MSPNYGHSFSYLLIDLDWHTGSNVCGSLVLWTYYPEDRQRLENNY